jgi:hypothetical protein
MGAMNFMSSSIEVMTYQSLDILLRSFEFLLVVDLEATCWAEGSGQREDMETIEFGAVLVDMETLEVLDSRSWFIRPRLHPRRGRADSARVESRCLGSMRSPGRCLARSWHTCCPKTAPSDAAARA